MSFIFALSFGLEELGDDNLAIIYKNFNFDFFLINYFSRTILIYNMYKYFSIIPQTHFFPFIDTYTICVPESTIRVFAK